MNWENLFNYVLENLPVILAQAATLTAVLLGRPKTAEQLKTAKKKALNKRHIKNAKLRAKLEEGYHIEDKMTKELEE